MTLLGPPGSPGGQLRLCAPNAGGPGPGFLPGQGTGSHMRQLKIPHAATKKKKKKKVLHAASETQHSQINKQIFKKKNLSSHSLLCSQCSFNCYFSHYKQG